MADEKPDEKPDESKENEPSREEVLTRENSFLRNELATYENLLMNSPFLAGNNTPAKTEEKKPEGTGVEKPKGELTLEAVTEHVKKTVFEPAKKAELKEEMKAQLTAMAADSKTKDVVNYIDEMKAISRDHPTLNMHQLYTLAKTTYGPKPDKAASKPKPEEIRVSQIRSAEGEGRWSGAPKIATPEQRTQVHTKAFQSAFDEAWDSVGMQE